jgi:hypothetical protein
MDKRAGEEVRSFLASQGHAPARIDQIMYCLGGGESTRITLPEARDLRSGILRAKIAAAREGKKQEAAVLAGIYDTLTDSMRRRAADLGMSEDFENADTAWRAIERAEEVLDPLRSVRTDSVEGAIAFQEAWQNRTPEMRAALKQLERYGGLDLKALEAKGKEGQTAHRQYRRFKRLYRFREFLISLGHLMRSPAALMCASCWALALSLVSMSHPLSLALALWLLPVSIAFAILYLAFEAWYRATGHETFTSPWGLPTVCAVLAVLAVLVRLIFG